MRDRDTTEEDNLWEKRPCKGKDTERFFGTQGSIKTALAKEICAECPILNRQRCLEMALATPEAEDHGVMGGLDEWERKKLRHKQTA